MTSLFEWSRLIAIKKILNLIQAKHINMPLKGPIEVNWCEKVREVMMKKKV
jgi:hypothetical protein